MKMRHTKIAAKKLIILLIALMLAALSLSLCACGGETIVWEDVVLGEMLPIPPKDKGEIHTNSKEALWIDVSDITEKQFADYIEACKEKGFTIDAESNSSTYSAFNDKGYELNLSHYGSNAEMSIRLESPMEMTTIAWPTSEAGGQLPAPKSTTGKFNYEYEDRFFVYIGNTTKTDYAAYVKECSDAGFTVDYKKGDDYYFADNVEGWHVDIRYEGNNIMSISIKAKDKDTEGAVTSTAVTEEQNPTDTAKDTTETNSLDPTFKASMDAYEKFMSEYVDFMKKYKANPTDLSLISAYANYISEYAKFVRDFEAWENKELNTAELAYYLDVQSRITQKLLEIAS